MLHAKSEPLFFDESFIDVVCLHRLPGGGSAKNVGTIYSTIAVLSPQNIRGKIFFTEMGQPRIRSK
jgi:hypothetical protein